MPKSPRRPAGPVSTRLHTLRRAKQWKMAELARRTGISMATLHRYETKVEPPPNHPFLAKIARAFGTSVAELTEGTTAAPMSETELATVERGRAAGSIRHPKQKTALLVHTNGAKRNGAKPGKRRNALLRNDGPHRQLVRGLAEKVNIARMRGERYITIDVPIPTDAFALLLEDYFGLKGIKKRVLIEADFTDVFG